MSFALMMWCGDHSLYLHDDVNGIVKLKHLATTGEKILPSVFMAAIATLAAALLNYAVGKCLPTKGALNQNAESETSAR